MNLMSNNSKRDVNVFVKNIFADFDLNKDNQLSFEEFTEISEMLPDVAIKPDLKEKFLTADSNENGNICLKGFFNVLFSYHFSN